MTNRKGTLLQFTIQGVPHVNSDRPMPEDRDMEDEMRFSLNSLIPGRIPNRYLKHAHRRLQKM